MLAKLCLIPLLVYTVTSYSQTATAEHQSSSAAGNPQEGSARPVTPRPNPDASGKYHIGDGVVAPILLKSNEPKYPEAAKKANVRSGGCLLRLTVDTEGFAKDIRIIRSSPTLEDSKLHDVAAAFQDNCIRAVEKYQFKPGTYQDKPVPVDLMLEVKFDRY